MLLFGRHVLEVFSFYGVFQTLTCPLLRANKIDAARINKLCMKNRLCALVKSSSRVGSETAAQSQSHITPKMSPVRLGVRSPSGTRDQFFYLLEMFF
jgi:hypothetical protein